MVDRAVAYDRDDQYTSRYDAQRCRLLSDDRHHHRIEI